MVAAILTANLIHWPSKLLTTSNLRGDDSGSHHIEDDRLANVRPHSCRYRKRPNAVTNKS